MPQITKITKQKKGERFNIFLQDQYAFSVNNYVLLENSLKVGVEVTQDQIKNILAKDQLGQLTDLSIKFLSFRPRSEKEVKDYLTKKIAQKSEIKVSQAQKSPLIAKVIEKLKRYKYINDRDFANWLLNSRLKSSSPRSLRVIKAELKIKGIDADLIENASKFTPNESEQAKKALSKKIGKWGKLETTEVKKKAYNYLASRGFDYEAIKDAVAFYTKKR